MSRKFLGRGFSKRNSSFFLYVGVESDQQVNICSFVVRCNRRWPNTQWHMVYTGSGNMPYVQFESVDEFIPEPRCSKFVVELQTEERKIEVHEVRLDSNLKGREWRELRYVLSVRACARGLNLVVLVVVCEWTNRFLFFGESTSPFIDEGDGFTSERGRVYVC